MDIIKSIIPFIIILILVIFKVPLWLALLAGTLIMGLIFGLGPVKILGVFYEGTIDETTANIVFAVVFIFYIGKLMESTGHFRKAEDALNRIFKNPLRTLISLPAFIGLLPMPGGAAVSAPLINKTCNDLKINKERRTFINYCFRHIWEYSWPLYPSIILLSEISKISLRKLSLMNLPYSIISFIVGYFFVRGWVNANKKTGRSSIKKNVYEVLSNTYPVVIIIFLAIVFNMPLTLSLIIALAVFLILAKISPRFAIKKLWESLSYKLILVVVFIMCYKAMMEETKVIILISKAIIDSGMPIFIIFMIVPMLAGLMLGYAPGVVGVTAPFLVKIMELQQLSPIYISALFGFGYIGVLCSPFHPCLFLTVEYYKSKMGKVYKYILPFCALMFVTICAWFGAWIMLG